MFFSREPLWLQSGSCLFLPALPKPVTCLSPITLVTVPACWWLLMDMSYCSDKARKSSKVCCDIGRSLYLLQHTEDTHVMNSWWISEWKNDERALCSIFPFNFATMSWEIHLGLELMTSWHPNLWSHHNVIVSKGVLFCIYPIFFSHKTGFYTLWFRNHL